MEAILTVTSEHNINKATNTIICDKLIIGIYKKSTEYVQIYDKAFKIKYALPVYKLNVCEHNIMLGNIKHAIISIKHVN